MLLKNDTAYLRALEPEDVDLLYFWENNPEIWKVSSTIAPFSKYTLTNYILEESSKDIFETKQQRFVIVEAKTDIPSGCVDMFDFDPIDLRATIGISVNEDTMRQKGLAKNALQLLEEYAAAMLHIHQLYARTDTDNAASIALFESCGYSRCGLLKDWHRTSDGWKDQIEFQKIFK